jgi:hypothetical protein
MEFGHFSYRLGLYHPTWDGERWRDPSLCGKQQQSREAAIAGHNPVLRTFSGYHH